MKALVIGGSGFIGTRLVGALVQAGHEVRIFDKEPGGQFDELVVRGDVREYDQLVRAVKGMDIVFHLAAEHRDDVHPASLYYDVNVGGARNLARAAEAEDVRKIVFTSTVAVYGLNQGEADEDTPADPFNDYGRSKLQAEEVLARWTESGHGRSLVVVRPTVVFGEENRGNVYTLIRQIATGKFAMIGNGSNRKSMCYVGNLVAFLMGLLEPGEGVRIVNYADKPDLTMQELVDLVRSELGINGGPPVRIPYWTGLIGGYVFDALSKVTGRSFSISSIRIKKFCANTQVAVGASVYPFAPPFTLQEGLRRMVRSMEN